MKSYVYVITDGRGSCKVGKANDVKKRLAGLQTGNSRRLSVAYKHPCKNPSRANLLESLVHKKLEKYNTIGEWFSVSADVAREVVKKTASEYKDFAIKGKQQKRQKKRCIKQAGSLYDLDIKEISKPVSS